MQNLSLSGDHLNDRHEKIDTKSNQWFGATVASAGVNGPLVVSIPKRHMFIESSRDGRERTRRSSKSTRGSSRSRSRSRAEIPCADSAPVVSTQFARR